MKLSPKSIYYWYRNALSNPSYRWWVIIGTLIYLISPLDLSPDRIPLAGQIDDFMILSLLFTELLKLISLAFQSPPETPENLSESEKEQPIKTIDVDAVRID